MHFLNPESKVMVILSKVADLMWLNLLTIMMCIPVITAGAALTAKDYMCYKILKNEEAGITKGFFHSFKQNFKQATAIWLMMLVVLGVAGFDVLFAHGLEGQGAGIIKAVMLAILFFIFISFHLSLSATLLLLLAPRLSITALHFHLSLFLTLLLLLVRALSTAVQV